MRSIALLAAAALALPAGAGAYTRPAPQHALHAVTAKNSISPVIPRFGDTVTAHIDVAIDTRYVDPARVAIDADFRPYARVDERLDRKRVGRTELVSLTETLRCLTGSCLPRGTKRRIPFARAHVSWPLANGRTRTLALRWPALNVVTRLDLIELTGLDPRAQPPWRADLATVPAVSYRVAPGAAFWTLVALAALLGAAGAFLLVRHRPRRTPAPVEEPPAPEVPPLERALAMLESARARNHLADQRRALELLAGELAETGEEPLSETARALAWSPATPPSEATGTLAANVRELIENGSNGHVD